MCKKLFPSYRHEQFLAFFGMLTGTASTGMILLREIDGSYRTPASENLVYQSLPAIVFGFPLMFLAPWAAESNMTALIVLIIIGACFIVLNVLLFRRSIFKKQFARADARHAALSEAQGSADASAADGTEDGSEDGTAGGFTGGASDGNPSDNPPSAPDDPTQKG